MHILIIEDEEQLCRSMAEGLRMDGYETVPSLPLQGGDRAARR